MLSEIPGTKLKNTCRPHSNGQDKAEQGLGGAVVNELLVAP